MLHCALLKSIAVAIVTTIVVECQVEVLEGRKRACLDDSQVRDNEGHNEEREELGHFRAASWRRGGVERYMIEAKAEGRLLHRGAETHRPAMFTQVREQKAM